jgi:metal-responsive CopG/Arc/MetJ family transcriptional regulator
MKVSIAIPKDLLAKIEKNVEGSSRNEKIVKCLEMGLHVAMKERSQP